MQIAKPNTSTKTASSESNTQTSLEAAPAAPPDKISIDLTRLQFLVVDDHRFSRTLIKTALRAHDLTQIIEAADAPSAFEALNNPETTVDFILVDHDMPILSGVEFTRIVRRGIDVPNPEVPIIMVSGLSAIEQVVEARNCGIHEFVAKPFTADILYKHIAQTMFWPRPFIRSSKYIGPDRRWLNAGTPSGKERRDSN
jgi:two-component system, chemotaxis family, chemotaxis protein CheY